MMAPSKNLPQELRLRLVDQRVLVEVVSAMMYSPAGEERS